MAHTYEELKKKRVVDLREMAKEIDHEAVKGYSQMNKDHLLEAICTALDIDMFEHHVVKDSHKGDIKARIKKLKKERDTILASDDRSSVKNVIHNIKKLKRQLRKMAV